MGEITVAVGLALLSLMGALFGSVIANLIAPTIEDKRQRRLINLQRQIVSVDAISAWVKEHLTATTLLYFSAFERTDDWRIAVLRYQESRATYVHSVALANNLHNAIKIAHGLESLLNMSEQLLVVAQERLHLERQRNSSDYSNQPATVDAQSSALEQSFEELRRQIMKEGAQLYDLLDSEATRLLGFKRRFGIL